MDDWIFHVLRREAEGLILPNLVALLDGTQPPRDNDERLALVGVCQFTNRFLAAARLYTDAFAADPNLVKDIGACHRYHAARAAALTGCGRSADGKEFGEAERKRWREQARRWLRAELATYRNFLDGDLAKWRAWVRWALVRWRETADLVGLREPNELENVSADERNDCAALWHEIDLEI